MSDSSVGVRENETREGKLREAVGRLRAERDEARAALAEQVKINRRAYEEGRLVTTQRNEARASVQAIVDAAREWRLAASHLVRESQRDFDTADAGARKRVAGTRLVRAVEALAALDAIHDPRRED